MKQFPSSIAEEIEGLWVLGTDVHPPQEACMNVRDLEIALHAEGFSQTYVWQDGPGAFYPEHTHPTVTAHIVLEGEITVVSEGKTRTYTTGERFDVPAGAPHCAKMGPDGCRYLIGEKL